MRHECLDTFERQVLVTSENFRLISPVSTPVLAALSGGPDSTALLLVLQSLHRVGRSGPVTACHVDHGLRPDSAADAEACRSLCQRLSIPIRVVRVEVADGNVQAEARRARYAALQ